MVFMCVALWMWTWAWTWHIYSTSTMEDSLTPRFINHSITHHLAQILFPLISIYLHISSHYLATSQLRNFAQASSHAYHAVFIFGPDIANLAGARTIPKAEAGVSDRRAGATSFVGFGRLAERAEE